MNRNTGVAAGLLLFFLFAPFAHGYPYSNPTVPDSAELVLEGVLIRGNWNITDDVIINTLDWEVGTVFNEKKLADGQTKLETTDLFRSVELSTRRGNKPGSIIVVVQVREKRLPYIDWFEAHHYSTGYAFNLFELETYTKNRTNYLKSDLRLTDPWSGFFLDYTLSPFGNMSTKFYGTSEASWQTWSIPALPEREGFEYTLNRFGLEGGIQFSTSTFGRIRFGIDYNITNINDDPIRYEDEDDSDGEEIDNPNQLPQPLRDVKDTNWTGLNLVLEKDGRDDDLFPHSGSLIYAPIYFASDSEADDQFIRFEIDARRYIPISRGTTLALRARAGFIEGDSPFYQRFNLSTGNGIRGVSDGWVDSPNGGTRMIQTAFELRHPLTGRWPDSFINLLLFSEAGASWNDEDPVYSNDPDYSDLKLTIGWGLAFHIPVLGPLSLSIGYPLIAPDDAEGINARLNFGMAF